MKVGAIVICRYNSSRLPGKILKSIDGQPIITHIIKRLKQIDGLEVVVATSLKKTDNPIEKYCLKNYQSYFRGSLNNVASRFSETAQAFNFDYAIRVNGDNLFIDIEAMKKMIALAKTNKFDFISNVKGRTFPYGMSIEIAKTSSYAKLQTQFSEDRHLEHVTSYIYENESCCKIKYHLNTAYPEASGLKIAIDTAEDFIRAKKIVEKLPNGLDHYSLQDIAKLIKKYQS